MDLASLIDRLVIEASARGVRRIALARGGDDVTPGGRRHARRARRELTEYLAGRRTFITAPVDLLGLGPFQLSVLTLTRAIPFGEARAYAALARAIGHPGAARAVGNALATNPVPLLVPGHRVVRSDGTWGKYALGPWVKTRLLELERRVTVASVADPRSLGHRRCSAGRHGDMLPAWP